jgi:hypothetical protein
VQQFVVPQFIDVEDKIFGPITTRQFLILLSAGLIIFLAYRFGDFSLFVFVLAFLGGLALVFAFVRVNGQTFHYFLLNVIQTLRKPALRVWRKEYSTSELEAWRKEFAVTKESAPTPAKVARQDRIRDLALIVNTGGYYRGDDDIL